MAWLHPSQVTKGLAVWQGRHQRHRPVQGRHLRRRHMSAQWWTRVACYWNLVVPVVSCVILSISCHGEKIGIFKGLKDWVLKNWDFKRVHRCDSMQFDTKVHRYRLAPNGIESHRIATVSIRFDAIRCHSMRIDIDELLLSNRIESHRWTFLKSQFFTTQSFGPLMDRKGM